MEAERPNSQQREIEYLRKENERLLSTVQLAMAHLADIAARSSVTSAQVPSNTNNISLLEEERTDAGI